MSYSSKWLSSIIKGIVLAGLVVVGRRGIESSVCRLCPLLKTAGVH